MDKNILSLQDISEVSKKIKRNQQTIALTGGCFDILHLGHIMLFKKAKESADIVFVMLESDTRIKELKGLSRPFYLQSDRAAMLLALKYVDYVICMPYVHTSDEYKDIVLSVSPNVLVTTEGDIHIAYKQEHAKLVHAKVLTIPYRTALSTTTIATFLEKQYDTYGDLNW